MFFTISQVQLEPEIPLKITNKINNFYLYTDEGWHRQNNIFYKGYCTEQSLHKKVTNRDFSEQNGNYCILDFTDRFSLHHDNSRSFPLFFNSSTLSNLQYDNTESLWFDASVIYNDTQFVYKKNSNNVIHFDRNAHELVSDAIVDLLCNHLVTECSSISNELPVYCSDSNGVDSIAVRASLDYCNIDYCLVSNHFGKLKNLGWGYGQLYVDTSAHLQATGFCGDEVVIRNPLYCQWLLDPYDIDLCSVFDKTEYCYMKNFFNKNYRKKILQRQQKFTSRKQAIEYTANVALNDFQMWHVDNTLTFTPFRNRNIAEQFLYADADAIVNQVTDAGISKAVIKKLNPELLDNISEHKNNCAA